MSPPIRSLAPVAPVGPVALDNGAASGTRVGVCRDLFTSQATTTTIGNLGTFNEPNNGMALLVFDTDPVASVQLDTVTIAAASWNMQLSSVSLSLNVVGANGQPVPFSYVPGYAPVTVYTDYSNVQNTVAGVPGSYAYSAPTVFSPNSGGMGIRLLTFRVRDAWPALAPGQRYALGYSSPLGLRAICGDSAAAMTNGLPGPLTPLGSWIVNPNPNIGPVPLTCLPSTEAFSFTVTLAGRSAAAADWSVPASAAGGAPPGAPLGTSAAVFMTNASFATRLGSLSAAVSANAVGTYSLALALWTASAATGLPLAPVAGAAPAIATLTVTPSLVGVASFTPFAMPASGAAAWPALLPSAAYAFVGSVTASRGAGSDSAGAGGVVSWATAAGAGAAAFAALDRAGALLPLGAAALSGASWSVLAPGANATLAVRASAGARLFVFADTTLGGADLGGGAQGTVAIPATASGTALAAVVSLPLATAQAELAAVSLPVLVQPPSGSTAPVWLSFRLSLLPALGAASATAGARALAAGRAAEPDGHGTLFGRVAGRRVGYAAARHL